MKLSASALTLSLCLASSTACQGQTPTQTPDPDRASLSEPAEPVTDRKAALKDRLAELAGTEPSAETALQSPRRFLPRNKLHLAFAGARGGTGPPGGPRGFDPLE